MAIDAVERTKPAEPAINTGLGSGYGWIITEDHSWRPAEPGDRYDVGLIGPRDTPESIMMRLARGEGIGFEMYDDDGHLMYRGRYVNDDDPDGEDETAFTPLDQFGRPNVGATSIHYWNRGRKEYVEL